MKKLSSMLKKELFISKGLFITKLLLGLSLLLLFWLIFISISSDPGMKASFLENNAGFLESFPIAISFVMMYLLVMPGVDPNHKADLNCGWLGYSYALPISPAVRAGALLLYRLIPVMIGFLLFILNNYAFCAYWETKLTAESFVYVFVFAAIFAFFNYPSDFFTLRARDKVEYKKYRSLGNFAMVVLLIVTFATAAKLSGVSLIDALDSEKDVHISLPHFKGTDLLWAIPLFIATEALSFFILYSSLKSSYAAAKSEKKQELPADYNITVAEDSPKGLFYLEFSQNRTFFFLVLLMPFAGILLPFLASLSALYSGTLDINGVFKLATSPMALIVVYLLLFIGVSILVTNMFANEGKKIWAYFIASCPGGSKAYVNNKYLFIFILDMLFHGSCMLANQLLATVSYFVTGNEMSPVSQVYLLGVFLFMFFNAMDIPLIFRFGSKKAGLIKLIGITGLLILATIVFAFLPQDVQDKAVEVFDKVMHGNIGNTGLMLLGLFPVVAAVLWALSAKISKKVYIAGAEGME